MIMIDCLHAVKTSRKKRCVMFYNYSYEIMKATDLTKRRSLGCIFKIYVIITHRCYCNGQGFHK